MMRAELMLVSSRVEREDTAEPSDPKSTGAGNCARGQETHMIVFFCYYTALVLVFSRS